MLIAALNRADGKIIQVAGPTFDWGTEGVRTLAFVQHDDPTIEAALNEQIAQGGPAFITYPYALYGKRRQIVEISTESYDLSLLSPALAAQLADDTAPSPILTPEDFVRPSLVTRLYTTAKGFFAAWL